MAGSGGVGWEVQGHVQKLTDEGNIFLAKDDERRELRSGKRRTMTKESLTLKVFATLGRRWVRGAKIQVLAVKWLDFNH